MAKKKKKFFLNLKSKKTRKKTLDELKKKDINISDEDKLSGGFMEYGGFGNPPLGTND